MTRLAVLVAGAAAIATTACGTGADGAGGAVGPTPAPTLSSTPPVTPAPTTPPATTASASSKPPTPPATSTASSTALPSWLADGVVTRLPTTRRVIALTFDCGAGAQGAAAILRELAAQRVPATFFLTGNFVRAFPDTTAAIARAGYVVGDHTVSHPHLTQLSSAAVTSQVTNAALTLTAAIGRSPKPWFRFPYGEYDQRTLAIVHRLGFGAIGWTVDSRGWQGTSAGTVQDVVDRVVRALRPGAVVLMHLGANPDDGTTYDADALPAVIAAARAAGYTFVSIAG